MTVEILYVAGCPNLEASRELVASVLAEAGVETKIRLVRVPSADGETNAAFAGSPTILIDGRDVEPAPPSGVACRIYANGTGCPSREVVQRAVRGAARSERSRHGS